QRGRVRDLDEAPVAHLEHTDFIGGTEPVLYRTQDAELVAAFSFEIKHGIDHMLEHARAGNDTFLCDVADKHQHEAAAFGDADEFLRGSAHLAYRPGCAV